MLRLPVALQMMGMPAPAEAELVHDLLLVASQGETSVTVALSPKAAYRGMPALVRSAALVVHPVARVAV